MFKQYGDWVEFPQGAFEEARDAYTKSAAIAVTMQLVEAMKAEGAFQVIVHENNQGVDDDGKPYTYATVGVKINVEIPDKDGTERKDTMEKKAMIQESPMRQMNKICVEAAEILLEEMKKAQEKGALVSVMKISRELSRLKIGPEMPDLQQAMDKLLSGARDMMEDGGKGVGLA